MFVALVGFIRAFRFESLEPHLGALARQCYVTSMHPDRTKKRCPPSPSTAELTRQTAPILEAGLCELSSNHMDLPLHENFLINRPV